ncbi:MAG: M20/M25/M40 family metallo-hydrolase [Proteobacteria bacterium]|nr:M20/M25/M40 family metallo-hydrolase [Pseudomonadota bacterium]
MSEFRSRHSPATEAVGYGKALMLFHMTRRQIGDEAFKRGLQKFYREQRGKRATFMDLARAFSAVAETDLLPMYEQWVTRAGAPDLRATDVTMARASAANESYAVRGTLRQVQKAAPFAMDIPVAIRTRAGVEMFKVASNQRDTKFEFVTQAEPLSVEIDPEFDLFRLLDARETAPSLGQMFGDPEIVAVLPAAASAETQAVYRKMIEFWGGGNAQKIDTRLDSARMALPKDRAIWFFGRDNTLAKQWFADDPAIGYAVADDGINAAGTNMPFKDHSTVVVRRNPGNPAKAVGWVTVDPLAAGEGLARKLPHYGKYSYLGFEGTEPANTAKGEWIAADSPLHVVLPASNAVPMAAAAPATNKFPPRRPLATLPAVFDGAAMIELVRWLADPARDGRGLGTEGLQAAGDYVADAFNAAGLVPGNGESYFQPFEFTPAGAKQPIRTRNVVGVLQGANPAFADQAVIVSAHYDHLGRSGPGVRVEEVGQLHPGADDNASGVAVMLELARTLAAAGAPPRTLVFIGFSGEESGLNGSKFFVANSTVPLAGIRAVVNLDTVGRLGNGEVTALATGTATEWQHVFRGITFTTGIPTKSIPGASQSSDQQSFIERGIPGIQLFTKAHLDYHRPTDTADKVDVDGLVKVATVARETIDYLVQRPEPLTITIDAAAGGNNAGPAGATSSGGADGTSRRVSFGLVPDYAQQARGVKAESVVPDSPAAHAGIVAGDVLLALDGVAINDLGAFSNALKQHVAGDKVKATILRDGVETVVAVELLAR